MGAIQVNLLRNGVTGTNLTDYARYSGLHFKDVTTGDLCWICNESTGYHSYLYTQTAQDVAPSLVTTLTNSYVAPVAATQDSAGNIHLLCHYASGARYIKYTVSRSGGHVTGITQSVSLALPTMTSALGGTVWLSTIAAVANGSSAERIMIGAVDGDDATNYAGALCHGPLSPTATADFVSLSGAAGWTKLPTQTCTANVGASYCFAFALEQHVGSAHMFAACGPSSRGDVGDYSTYPVGYRLTASSTTWAVETGTPRTLCTATYESFLGHSCRDGDGNVYLTWTQRGSSGSVTIGISKVESDGTFTASWLSTTSDQAAEIKPFPAVCSDGTVILALAPGDTGASASRHEIKVYTNSTWYTYCAASTRANILSWIQRGSRGWQDGIVWSSGDSAYPATCSFGSIHLRSGSETGVLYDNYSLPVESGTGTISPTIPTAVPHATRNQYACVVCQKSTSTSGGTITYPSGWTKRAEILGAGGQGSQGADVGNVDVAIGTKDSVDGSESGAISVTLGSYNSALAMMVRCTRTNDGEWLYDAATGSDTTAGADVSVAFGSVAVDVGDLLVIAWAQPTDVNGVRELTGQAISASGITFGEVQVLAEGITTQGNDLACWVGTVRVLAGTGTVTPTWTATATGTTTNVVGGAALLRLRQANANSVEAVEAPEAPTETATVSQNMNYVQAGTNSPAAPEEIGSALEVAVPTWVETSAVASGTTSVTLTMPATRQKGRILLAILESANQAISVTDGGGLTWTEAYAQQGTGTAGGTSATLLAVYWARDNGTSTAPVFACASGNHVCGVISSFLGCVPEGSPVHVSTGGVKGTSSTTTSVAGSTTTKANCLVVVAVSRMNDLATAHWSAWTNASLSSITEIADTGTTTGNGGGFGVCCGGKASAGTYSTTTATNATTTTNGFMTVALLGVESGTAVVAHAVESPDAATQTATLSQSSGSASVEAVESPAAATETATLLQTNTVTASQGPAAPTETATIAGSNSVAATESPAAATETAALGQASAVVATQSPDAPTETGTLLSPSLVTMSQGPAAPTETLAIWQQNVSASQSPDAPTETATAWQGSAVVATEAPSAPAETATVSQYNVAGVEGPAPPTETLAVTQPSTVTGVQATAQPVETATLLQTNAVVMAEEPTAPNETGIAAQASAVVGVQAPAAAGETQSIVQGARVTMTEAPTQPSQTAALTQPSHVVAVEVPAQPTETATLLQVSSVVMVESCTAPIETGTLQQGSLVESYEETEVPEQTATLGQIYSVRCVESPAQPTETAQLYATSRVDAIQLPAAPTETDSLVTYQPNAVYCQQSTPQPVETCAIATTWAGERPSPHSILADDGICADIEIINEAQMKPIYVGGMVNRRIVVRDGDGVLFTPDQLRVSFRWPDRTEELVTFGGTALNDSWLRSVSIGVFRFSCPAKAQAGNGSLLVSLTHLVSGIEQTEEARQIVTIYALTNTRLDVP